MLILDSLECNSCGSVVMRNAKNPNCLDLANVPEQKMSQRSFAITEGGKKIHLEKIFYVLRRNS